MTEFRVVPKIVTVKSVDEFTDIYDINKNDLVITNDFTWKAYFKKCTANTVFLQSYGSGEPTDEMVKAICVDIKNSYKRVIAIGGGSVIDIAKLFVLNVSYDLDTKLDALYDKKISAVKDKKLVIVPTTCGTGSEVTNISILEFKKRNTKFGLAADALYADDAVILPELLNKLPFLVFAASSIDALIHSIESYLSPNATELSTMFSARAMSMILSGYIRIEKMGKKAVDHELFLTASTYAGIAFSNAGCAAVHAMSYPLGAAFHVPHGESNYAVFGGVMDKYMEIMPQGRIRELNNILAESLSCSMDEVYTRLYELLDNSILKRKRLSEYGLISSQIEEFADSVLKNQQRLLKNNYAELTKEDIIEIYTKLF